MAKLSLRLACNPYARVQPLLSGSVQPDGVELNFISRLSPSEIFWRMLRHEEFDVSELSLSAYILGLARAILVPEYHMAALLYIRGALKHDYGVGWIAEYASVPFGVSPGGLLVTAMAVGTALLMPRVRELD